MPYDTHPSESIRRATDFSYFCELSRAELISVLNIRFLSFLEEPTKGRSADGTAALRLVAAVNALLTEFGRCSDESLQMEFRAFQKFELLCEKAHTASP